MSVIDNLIAIQKVALWDYGDFYLGSPSHKKKASNYYQIK